MSFMGNILGRTGAAALAVGAGFALAPMAANAATIHATSAEVIKDGPRGTADGGDDVSNAFGEADGAFFELGYDAVVEFQFGTPTGQAFFASGALVEVTFDNNPNWKEAVLIEVGRKGIADSFVAANPNPFVNTETFDNPAFAAEGAFDTVRLTDLTRSLFSGGAGNTPSGSGSASSGSASSGALSSGSFLSGPGGTNASTQGATGGLDVDSISVTAVPVPAAGFLLFGALGGLLAFRRRR